MSTARISVNVDAETKQNAQRILGEIGMDLTTVINLLLRTIVREERIPFDLRTEKAYLDMYKQYIGIELEKSKAEAVNPRTQWLSHDYVLSQMRKQRESRHDI
jgi:DNA-damage-inducible protein J